VRSLKPGKTCSPLRPPNKLSIAYYYSLHSNVLIIIDLRLSLVNLLLIPLRLSCLFKVNSQGKMHAMSGGDASRRPVAISKQWQPAASKVSVSMEKSIVKNATIIVEPVSKPPISSPSPSSSPSMWMLALCAGGICTSYLWYGMIEERLHMSPAMPPMTAFLLVSQCITNVLVAKTSSTLFPSEKPKHEKRSLCHPLFLLSKSLSSALACLVRHVLPQ
jgi:hypothetical protein